MVKNKQVKIVTFLLSTTFKRFFNGLNLGGILSQTLRPIITAFLFPLSDVDVVSLTNRAISAGKCHGKPPFRPIPPQSSIATISFICILLVIVILKYPSRQS